GAGRWLGPARWACGWYPLECVVSKARAEPSSVVFVCSGVGGVCCSAALPRGCSALVAWVGGAWCGLFFRWSWGGSDEGFGWLGMGCCAIRCVLGSAEPGICR